VRGLDKNKLDPAAPGSKFTAVITCCCPIVESTERYRRDAAMDMLFGELRHRTKNLLAVAQSIARQTRRRVVRQRNTAVTSWAVSVPWWKPRIGVSPSRMRVV
jgi:hypothetical protein